MLLKERDKKLQSGEKNSLFFVIHCMHSTIQPDDIYFYHMLHSTTLSYTISFSILYTRYISYTTIVDKSLGTNLHFWAHVRRDYNFIC